MSPGEDRRRASHPEETGLDSECHVSIGPVARFDVGGYAGRTQTRVVARGEFPHRVCADNDEWAGHLVDGARRGRRQRLHSLSDVRSPAHFALRSSGAFLPGNTTRVGSPA